MESLYADRGLIYINDSEPNEKKYPENTQTNNICFVLAEETSDWNSRT